jgi:hypothetical protein
MDREINCFIDRQQFNVSLPATNKDHKSFVSQGNSKKTVVVGASQKTTKGHSPKISKSKREFVRISQPVKNQVYTERLMTSIGNVSTPSFMNVSHDGNGIQKVNITIDNNQVGTTPSIQSSKSNTRGKSKVNYIHKNMQQLMEAQRVARAQITSKYLNPSSANQSTHNVSQSANTSQLNHNYQPSRERTSRNEKISQV